VWTISAVGEAVSRLRGRPHILNLDKAREATAGSWSCSAEKLKQQTGFQPLYPLQERIDQITRWYLDEGWLSTR
jgi:nucleoside-diphosphate-sugar epimerase